MLDFLKGKDASQVWCSFPNPQFTGKVWVALGPAEQCLAAAMWSYFIYPDHNITNEQGQSLQPGKAHSVGTQSLPFISLRLLFSLRSNNTPLFCLYLLSILPLILCSYRLTFSIKKRRHPVFHGPSQWQITFHFPSSQLLGCMHLYTWLTLSPVWPLVTFSMWSPVIIGTHPQCKMS